MFRSQEKDTIFTVSFDSELMKSWEKLFKSKPVKEQREGEGRGTERGNSTNLEWEVCAAIIYIELRWGYEEEGG